MPLHADDGAPLRLAGLVSVEEAEPLAVWLRTHPGGAVDLSACDHLHTAALQALLCARPPLAGLPAEHTFLGRWVTPWLVDALSLSAPVPGGTP